MNLFAELQERVRKCGDDVNAIIEISNEMHKYNCRVCPRNMYQDATSKTICPAMRGKSCRRNFATCWRRYFKEKEQGGVMGNVKNCCICGKQIDGLGNDAHPFARGTCCDACNTKWVVSYRLRLQRIQKTRIDADALANKIQKHASEKLNAYIGKRVALTMCDGEVEVGTLHIDTPAIRFMTYAETDNKEIIGYYIDRDPRGELHFRKSHVKHIKALDAANSAKTDTPIKTVYIPARAEHDGIHGVNVKLRWVCPKCGAPRGEVKSGRSYDGSRILFCDTWQNPCGHVDKYADVRAEAAANGLNGDVMSGGGGVNDKPIDRPADNRSRQGVQP